MRDPASNETLTTYTGAALIVLLAVLGLTIVALGRLLWMHLFLGLLLVGPLALKMASTGYRFVRYYTHDATYRRKGPPAPALRALAPIVVASTLVVMGTGVALLLVGPSSRSTLLPIHKISFIVWVAVTAIHVLAHLPATAGALGVHLTPDPRPAPKPARPLAAGGTLAAAIVIGLVFALLLIPDFAPWLHAQAARHH